MPFEAECLFTKMLNKLKSMLKLHRDFKQKTSWTVKTINLEYFKGN